MKELSAHAKISHTANGPALFRTYADIPLSKEILAAAKLLSGGEEIPGREALLKLVPFFEARYRFTDRVLRESGIKQIFEHAAGLTPRSLMFGMKNSDARCVEIDLPGEIEIKRNVVEILIEQGTIIRPTNVWFESGNVTDMVALATASRHFRNEPIAIVNEGLDRYLCLFERGLKLRHNHDLLSHFGGIYVTTDIPTKPGMAAINKVLGRDGESELEEKLGFKMSEHYFENVEEADRFYNRQHFDVKVHSLAEMMGELASPNNLGLNLLEVEEMLRSLYAFVLRPRRK